MNKCCLILFMLVFAVGCIEELSGSDDGDSGCRGEGLNYASCISKIAIKKKNVSICDDVGDSYSQRYCYHMYAARVDYGLCSREDNVGLRDDCYFNAAKILVNLKPCDHVSAEGKEDCIMQTALETITPEFCAELKDASKSALCRNTVHRMAPKTIAE